MASNSSLALRTLFMMFRGSLKNFLEVNTVQDEEKKKGIFLLALHKDLEELLRQLCASVEPVELSYDELMAKLEQVLRPDELLQEYTPAERLLEQPRLPSSPAEAKPSGSQDVPVANIRQNVINETVNRQYNIQSFKEREQTAINPLPYKLKPALSTFRGRDEYLGRLYETFNKLDCKVVVVHGFSGVGKSELVNQYAWRNIERYQKNIIWINAELLKVEFSTVAGELDVNTRRTELAQPLERPMCQVTKDVYSKLKKKGDCLLVLDDALTKDTVSEFLPGDQHESMHVLITSPYAHWEGVHTINLLPLTYNESEQILLVALDNKVDLKTYKEDFNNLVKILSGIPLAIQICAAYISNECRVFEENFVLSSYVNKLKTEKENYENLFLQFLSQSSEPENEKTMYASFLTTLKKINIITKNSKLFSDTLKIINISAYLNGEIIPISLLQKISKINDENLTRVIRILVDFSLINKDDSHEVRMHKLIQDVVILNQRQSNDDSKWYKKVFEYFLKYDESDESQVSNILSHAQRHQQILITFYNNKSYKIRLLKLLVIHDCNSILKYIFEQVNNHKKIKKLVRDNNLLHVAVRYNHKRMVDTLLMYVDKLDILDEDGLSPLMVAAARGLKDIAAMLIEVGAQQVLGESPPGKFKFLRQGQGHVEVIDVNYEDDPAAMIWIDKNGDILLHLAARRGLVALCKHRLAAPGCDVNALNSSGDIPLHLAAKYGHVDVCQVLLESQCSDKVMNKEGWCPIHLAARHGHVEVVQVLVEKNPSSAVWFDKWNKTTPMFLAVTHGHISVLQYLLDVEGVTLDTLEGVFQRTALMQAIAEGQTETVLWLLQHGASVHARDKYHWTALYYASRYGHTEIAALLAGTFCCDVNALDNEGRSPLFVAATWGHLGVVKVLIDAKAKIDLQNMEGWSPLHGAASGNHLAIVRALIKAKANINLLTKAGVTPLKLAKRWNNSKLERALTPTSPYFKFRFFRKNHPNLPGLGQTVPKPD